MMQQLTHCKCDLCGFEFVSNDMWRIKYERIEMDENSCDGRWIDETENGPEICLPCKIRVFDAIMKVKEELNNGSKCNS